MKRHRSKPLGEIGPILISPEGQSSGFRRVDLPDGKEEIEQFIVNLALKVEPRLRELYGLIDEPERTRENDFDFTVKTKSGNQYLELTEIAPLELTGGRYDGRQYLTIKEQWLIWLAASLRRKPRNTVVAPGRRCIS